MENKPDLSRKINQICRHSFFAGSTKAIVCGLQRIFGRMAAV